MHELSIAQSLYQLAESRTPKGSVVRKVHVRAGPMRGIEPTAMQWAWQSVTAGLALEGAQLVLELLPWRLHCPLCNREFSADDLFAPCSCGCQQTSLIGGDELSLICLEVDDPGRVSSTVTEKPHASAGS